MLSERRSLVMQVPQYLAIALVSVVFQTWVDFSQTRSAMRQQGQSDLDPVSTEMFQLRQEVYSFRCSTDLEQGHDGWVESLERRKHQSETLA